MKETTVKKYFFIIFLVAILIRCLFITHPLLEAASTRQTENAQIARNFYKEALQQKLNILYPYLSDDGNEKVYQLFFNLLSSAKYC